MTLDVRVLNITRFVMALLVLVSLRIVYWQMIRGEDLNPIAINPVRAEEVYGDISGGSSGEEPLPAQPVQPTPVPLENLHNLPQPVIQRTREWLETITRGSIYDRNMRLLAADLPNQDGSIVRYYSEPSLAHTLGYVSGFRTGVTGLERFYNSPLLGLDRTGTQIDQMLHRPTAGSDLILTIDSSVQRAAENALRGQSGSVLVLDAQSGAVLALANAPRYDPNRILEVGYIQELIESCSPPRCAAPFLNRAMQGRYSPGSTWKILPLIAAVDTGQVTVETVFDFGEPVMGPNGPYFIYTVDGGVIPDPNHRERRLNLEMSFARSANAAFARIGDEMPPERMIDYSARFGFGAPGQIRYPFELDFVPAQLANNVDSLYENNLLRAATAIGQGELLTSPMNIAMLVLAVINEGHLPLPYIVQAVQEPDGDRTEALPNRQMLRQTMQPETARQVRKMMISVVEKGTGQRARIAGAVVGGKTGTAQVGEDLAPHSWFSGFAQEGDRGVVVVVLIEHGGEGSRTAAPLFAEIAGAALRRAGEPVDELVPRPQPPEPQQAEPENEVEPGEEAKLPQAAVDELEEENAIGFPTPAPDSGALPAPDIPRDPAKNDITAANPACAEGREMPQATGLFIWPSPYQALSGGDFVEGHPGLDLSAPQGSPVFAADTGLVIFAGWSGQGYGNVILIDHGNGFRTLYAHLSQVSVFCGAQVEKGSLIGLSGNTGNSTGAHLHFEVRVPGGYLNPLRVLPLP